MSTQVAEFSWPADFAERVRRDFGPSAHIDELLNTNNRFLERVLNDCVLADKISPERVLKAINLGGDELTELGLIAEELIRRRDLYHECSQIIDAFGRPAPQL